MPPSTTPVQLLASPVLLWTIFAVTYVGIALGRFPKLVLDRTGIALLGAIAMLVAQGISIPEAVRHIDFETLLLLFGLMIFSAQLRVAGFYDAAASRLTRLTSRPYLLLASLILVSAFLSALLANDIVCLAFTPLLCTALLAARRDPIPYLLALATSANLGSAATIIGNPQNMYIGTAARLPFANFTLAMLPPTIVSLAICYAAVVLLFRRSLHATLDAPGRPPRWQFAEGDTLHPSSRPLETRPAILDRYLIAKALVLVSALVLYFLFAHGPDAAQHRAIATLAGAGLLLTSHRAKAARLYQYVDWNLILLFLGLFVVNGAMQEQHLTENLFAAIGRAKVDLSSLPTLAAVTTALSNLVSNVPAVLLLKPSVAATASQAHSNVPWYLLALVSTWAGNLTLVGSIANLIVAESASAFGVRITLPVYCRLGIPLTLVTVTLGTAYLLAVR